MSPGRSSVRSVTGPVTVALSIVASPAISPSPTIPERATHGGRASDSPLLGPAQVSGHLMARTFCRPSDRLRVLVLAPAICASPGQQPEQPVDGHADQDADPGPSELSGRQPSHNGG